MRGAVVVVVGASGGLGSAIAAELSARGALVIGAGRSGPDLHLDIRDSHAGDEHRDARRTAVLEAEGYRVLRFINADVMTNLDGVLPTISSSAMTAPLPNSPRRGEG